MTRPLGHFFRLQPRSCSKIFESGSGSGKFFKFENPTPVQAPTTIEATEYTQWFYKSRQSKITNGPRRLLLLLKLKSDYGCGSGFSKIFGSASERKMQKPAGVDSDTPDPWPPLSGTSLGYTCATRTRTQIAQCNLLLSFSCASKMDQNLRNAFYDLYFPFPCIITYFAAFKINTILKFVIMM